MYKMSAEKLIKNTGRNNKDWRSIGKNGREV